MDTLYDQSTPVIPSAIQKSSSSCPPVLPPPRANHGGRQREETPLFLTPDDAHVWAKERIKKDNHNQSKCRRLIV